MSLKELYKENLNRRFCKITKIKNENVTLTMDSIKTLKEHFIVLLIIIAIVVAMLLQKFDPVYFGVCMLLIAILIVLFIYGNKANLVCEKDYIWIKQGFQDVKIPYDRLTHVYLARISRVFNVAQAFNYNITFRYQDNMKFTREIELSVTCADKKELSDFLNNFEIEELPDQKSVRYEKVKSFKRNFFNILTFIVVAIASIVIIKSQGIF